MKSFDKRLHKELDLIYIYYIIWLRAWQKSAKIFNQRLAKDSLIYKKID